MQYRRLGRTELQVSVAGLGTGGPTRLGQSTGVSEADASRVVHRALDLGINLIDTAAVYGESEAILGRALRQVPRDRYIISTKFPTPQDPAAPLPLEAFERSLHRSLRRLQVDYLDIYHIHGVVPQMYDRVIPQYLDEAQRWQQQGKFRFLGITELHAVDPQHQVLRRALADDHFDAIMVGYDFLSPTAEDLMLPEAQRRDVGVLVMKAVHRVLSRPADLVQTIRDLKSRGLLAQDVLPSEAPLDWLIRDHVDSVPSAAYKYVAEHPAVASVLTGTANLGHLEANVSAILGPPLPPADRTRLQGLFGHIQENVGG